MKHDRRECWREWFRSEGSEERKTEREREKKNKVTLEIRVN